jgi:hypothetical protein
MIRRLADRLHIVVTCRTTAKYGVMVHLLKRKPGICTMAVLTEVSAQNMVCWLCRCADATPFGVTRSALRWRALKDGTHVTSLAVDCDMRAVEPEACRKMVEI